MVARIFDSIVGVSIIRNIATFLENSLSIGLHSLRDSFD